MIRILVTLIILVILKTGTSQNSNLKNVLRYPSTEVLVTAIHESIPNSPIENNDSLTYILGKWESIDGRNEAAERVKILQDIAHGQFNSDNYTYYYKYFISNYLCRIQWAEQVNHKEIYDERKVFLNYVPLNSKFDAWTKNIAEEFLAKHKYGSDEYLICLLLSNKLDSFDNELRGKKYSSSRIKTIYVNSHRVIRKTEGFYKLYVGHWLPLSRLSQDFKPSLNLGVSFGLPVKLKYRIEAKFQVAVSPSKSELEFRFDDKIYRTSNLTIINAGFRFTKEHKINKDLFFDASAELNLSVISSDIKDPNGENNNSTHGVETIDLGIGLGVKKFVGDQNAIGIETFLHAAPYNLNNELLSSSGFLSLSSSIFYSF